MVGSIGKASCARALRIEPRLARFHPGVAGLAEKIVTLHTSILDTPDTVGTTKPA